MLVYEQMAERERADVALGESTRAIAPARLLEKWTWVNAFRFVYSSLYADYGAAVAIKPQVLKDSDFLIEKTEDEDSDEASHPCDYARHC